MHELGIAEAIVGVVAEAAGGARVRRVVVEIGKLSAVLPDALRFCWELASEDTAAQGAVLEIIEMPGRARCKACGAEILLDRAWGVCTCGGNDLEWVAGAGEELRVREMEVM
jgi:hydrogenase nickel incorporation protein HypA/HybF